MRSLIRFVSHNSFIIVAVLAGGLFGYVLTRDGLGWLDVAALALYVAGAVLLWNGLRTPARQLARFDSTAAFERALRGDDPTLVAFVAANCAVSMAMRPRLDWLERDSGRRLQVLRLDVHDPTGRALADRYGLLLTPTFLLFNSHGLVEEEFTLVLNRPRVLYWLDQQTITP